MILINCICGNITISVQFVPLYFSHFLAKRSESNELIGTITSRERKKRCYICLQFYLFVQSSLGIQNISFSFYFHSFLIPDWVQTKSISVIKSLCYCRYNIFSTLLQYYYYAKKGNESETWKIQPNKKEHLNDYKWWLPCLDIYAQKSKRGPNYSLFCTINICVASSFAALATELCIRGYSKMYWEIDEKGWLYYLTYSTIIPIVYENVAEYYWHRLMHVPYFYKRLHKIHHYFKSPGFFFFYFSSKKKILIKNSNLFF